MFLKRSLFFYFFCACTNPLYGWDQELSLGYGNFREFYKTYHIEGLYLKAMMAKWQVDKTLIFGVEGTLTYMNAKTDHDRHNLALGILGDARAYFAPPRSEDGKNIRSWNPYLSISPGFAYITKRQLGETKQGTNLLMQSTLSFGLEWLWDSEGQKGMTFSFSLVHFCNSGLAKPNQGFELMPVSLGYLY